MQIPITTSISSGQQPGNLGGKRARKPQLRRTSFLITLNSNISVTHLPTEQQAVLRGKFTEQVNQLTKTVLGKAIIVGESREAERFPEYNLENYPLEKRIIADDVYYPTLRGNVEIGPRNGFIHIHMLLTIPHRIAKVKLNIPMIREEMSKIMGPGKYLNIRYVKDGIADAKAYIEKEMHHL